jgi:hypothetical protein
MIKINLKSSASQKILGGLGAPIILGMTLYYFFPSLYIDPRFWAEEGSLYYPLAIEQGSSFLLSAVN